ncbi:hypothetical protein N8500_01655 [Candidatus Puniceispirillum sp.]|nr:hypothetical protein [Candidatus Puniceispirillum sp.]
MKKVRRNLAGLIFVALGIIFLYLDMAPTMDHMNHGEHMNHEPTAHSVTLLGIGEMTAGVNIVKAQNRRTRQHFF